MDKFFNEIKRIVCIKKGIVESKKLKGEGKWKREDLVESGSICFIFEEGDEVDFEMVVDDDELDSEDDWVLG